MDIFDTFLNAKNFPFDKDAVDRLEPMDRIKLLSYLNGNRDSDGNLDLNKSLLSAILSADEKISRFLVAQGADINASNKGEPIISMQIHAGNIPGIELAIKLGVDLEVRDKEDFSPLDTACNIGNEAVVKLLVANGVNVNACDRDGGTALFWLLRGFSPNVELFKFMLESGANLDVIDTNGLTVRQIAEMKNHNDILALIDNSYQQSFFEERQLEQSVCSSEKPDSMAF